MNACMEKRHYHIIAPLRTNQTETLSVDSIPTFDATTLDASLKVINVTSETLSESKSMTAYSLARSFAREGHRTILLELDFRSPVLLQWLCENNVLKLEDVIQDATSLASAIMPLSDHLDMLCGAERTEGIAGFFLGRVFKQFIHRLKDSYDKVIIDAPPLNKHKDALILRDYACATIVVHPRV